MSLRLAYGQEVSTPEVSAQDVTIIIGEIAKYGTLPLILAVVILFLIRENRILRKALDKQT